MSDKKLKLKRNKINFDQVDQDGDNHIMTSIDNALSDDAFALTDEEKISIIQEDFKNIMLTLGLDLNDDSNKATLPELILTDNSNFRMKMTNDNYNTTQIMETESTLASTC